jgi:hypothetical protein
MKAQAFIRDSDESNYTTKNGEVEINQSLSEGKLTLTLEIDNKYIDCQSKIKEIEILFDGRVVLEVNYLNNSQELN